MTLPRRIQLVKLLKSHGLRGVERMREEEVREALRKLRVVPGFTTDAVKDVPSSASFAKQSEPAPPLPDDDDPYALPRFREPRLFLPDHDRTFLRAICVKPRLAFFTWDVHRDRARDSKNTRLEVRWVEFIGDPPDAGSIAPNSPQLTVPVGVHAGGWYAPVPGERLALVGTLVDDAGVIATSNVSLAAPARPAPPGPLWLATLPPTLDRRALLQKRLLKGEVPDARLVRKGESDARAFALDDDELPASGALFRLISGPSSSSSGSGGRG